MRLDPAKTIIETLGGVAAVRQITGAGETAPYRWQHRRDKGGTGGLIPQKYMPTLLAHARERGIALKAEDFLPAEPDRASTSLTSGEKAA